MTYFGDTFYFLVPLNPSDKAHARARSIALTRPTPILTTEWVLTELAYGMNAGQQRHAVVTEST
ncbi:MAG TPA: hypothetical protein VFE58_14015 [Tepidisphaeraceae bacterium]|jgi:hypothetical protein|nr:hypothetical protein [Tepidisphaeraceae bacterium]